MKYLFDASAIFRAIKENKIDPNEENKPKPKNAYVKSNRHNRKFHRR